MAFRQYDPLNLAGHSTTIEEVKYKVNKKKHPYA